jgi:hypothetical protein
MILDSKVPSWEQRKSWTFAGLHLVSNYSELLQVC